MHHHALDRPALALVAALGLCSLTACVDGSAQGGPPLDRDGPAAGASGASGGSTAQGGSGGASAGNGSTAGGMDRGGSTAQGGSGGANAGANSGGSSGNSGLIAATPADAATAYATFKTSFESCGDGSVRVKTNGDETVSEGIAYGMLAAVGSDDQPSFAGLWQYYSSHSNANGLMDWKINACTSQVWE